MRITRNTPWQPVGKSVLTTRWMIADNNDEGVEADDDNDDDDDSAELASDDMKNRQQMPTPVVAAKAEVPKN